MRAAERGSDPPGMWLLADGIAPRPDLGRSWTYVRADGTRRRAALNVTQPGEDAQFGYVAVATDVTEREQIGHPARAALRHQARGCTHSLVEQNQRLRELTKVKDDVVATVSHELRTPLTSIRGFVELLLDSEPDALDDEQRRMLRIIDRNSQQLLRVAEDLLSEANATWGLHVEFVRCDLAQLTREACDAMAAIAADRRVTLSSVTPDPVIVLGDPARLHQLLANLLSNACKFTPAGGRVVIQADVVDDFARLEVHDDGPGIPVEDRRSSSSASTGWPPAGPRASRGPGSAWPSPRPWSTRTAGPSTSSTSRAGRPRSGSSCPFPRAGSSPADRPAPRGSAPSQSPARPDKIGVSPEPSLLPGRLELTQPGAARIQPARLASPTGRAYQALLPGPAGARFRRPVQNRPGTSDARPTWAQARGWPPGPGACVGSGPAGAGGLVGVLDRLGLLADALGQRGQPHGLPAEPPAQGSRMARSTLSRPSWSTPKRTRPSRPWLR